MKGHITSPLISVCDHCSNWLSYLWMKRTLPLFASDLGTVRQQQVALTRTVQAGFWLGAGGETVAGQHPCCSLQAKLLTCLWPKKASTSMAALVEPFLFLVSSAKDCTPTSRSYPFIHLVLSFSLSTVLCCRYLFEHRSCRRFLTWPLAPIMLLRYPVIWSPTTMWLQMVRDCHWCLFGSVESAATRSNSLFAYPLVHPPFWVCFWRALYLWNGRGFTVLRDESHHVILK